MTEIIDIVEPYITGPQGPGGTIESATAVGLAPGAEPTVTLGGTPEQRTIEFGIPEGEQGTPATITSATAETLPPQSAATVTVGGTPSARTFAFGIPKGEPGSGSVNSVNGDYGPDIVLGPSDVGGSTSPTAGTMLMRTTGGGVPGVGAPTSATDAANKEYVDSAKSDLTDGIANATARIENAEDQIDALASVMATSDDLLFTAIIQGIANGANLVTESAFSHYNEFFVAPYPVRIISANIMFGRAQTAPDSTNYFNLALRRFRANAGVQVVEKSLLGNPAAQRTVWSFDGATWNEEARILQVGDGLAFGGSAMGSPKITYPVAITVRFERVVP